MAFYLFVGLLNLIIIIRFLIRLSRATPGTNSINILVITGNLISITQLVSDFIATYIPPEDPTLILTIDYCTSPLCILILMLLQHQIRMIFVSLAPILSRDHFRKFGCRLIR
eukprot:jgi/Hompol1/709/HPOL_005390-RA